jgi:hypothetical protein
VDVDELDRTMRKTRSGLVFLRLSVPDHVVGEAHARRHMLIKESLSAAILLFLTWMLMLSIMLLVRRPSGMIS